jgi:acyl-CoA thioester hydrolase
MTLRSLDQYPHHFTVQTRRSDSVGNGHIPNAVLASYFDDAREGLHTVVMAHSPYVDTASLSLVLGEIGMRFLGGVSFPECLTIGVGISRIGRTSIEEAAGFFCEDRCLVLAWCTMIKLVDRRPSPLTEEERARMERYQVV